jgi:hypothetical protein
MPRYTICCLARNWPQDFQTFRTKNRRQIAEIRFFPIWLLKDIFSKSKLCPNVGVCTYMTYMHAWNVEHFGKKIFGLICRNHIFLSYCFYTYIGNQAMSLWVRLRGYGKRFFYLCRALEKARQLAKPNVTLGLRPVFDNFVFWGGKISRGANCQLN